MNFCPDGALPSERGDDILPVLNRWIASVTASGVPIYASLDWRPAGHSHETLEVD